MNLRPWKLIVRLALLVAVFFLMPFSHIVHARATRADPRVRERIPAAAGMPQANVPIVDVWYGSTQTFGSLGLPQDRINILGNLSPSEGFALEYSLNGSAFQPVTLGTNSIRLVNEGDFNIELFDPDYIPSNMKDAPPVFLSKGANSLVLRVIEAETKTEVTAARRQLTIHYTPLEEQTWPLPYSIQWSSAGSISKVAQVIDGQWEITGGGVRIREPGYDRLIGIGSMDWDDYEVRTSFIVHGQPSANEGGIGILLGWQGHYQRDPGEWPTTGWARLGGYGYYSFRPNKHLVIRLNDADPPNGQVFNFEFGARYHLVMQVETDPADPDKSHYRVKMWKEGDSEPASWGVQRTDEQDRRPTGSVLLVAHMLDATFGDVSIRPLGQGTCYSLSLSSQGSGSVTVNPQKACYAPGDSVTLSANPAGGHAFEKWTVNGVAQTGSPYTFTINQNTSVVATFTPVQQTYTLTYNAGPIGGTITGTQPGTYNSGQSITLTASPAGGFVFQKWLVNGQERTNNPLNFTLQANTEVAAVFAPTSPGETTASVFLPMVIR